jgi:GAF domain-containing protein
VAAERDTMKPLADLDEVTQPFLDARLEPEAVLSTVTSTLSRLHAGTWVAMLINKDPRTVRVVAANHSDPVLARYIENMQVSGEAALSGISGQVIESGQPLLLSNVPMARIDEMVHADVRSYIDTNSPPARSRLVGVTVVPMRARGATVGTLGVYGGHSSEPLPPAHVAWLQAVADRAGLATENAQLFSDAARRLERLTALRNIGLAISSSPDLRLTLQVILDQVTAGLSVDAADVMLLDEAGDLVLSAQIGFQSTSVPEYRLPVDDQLPGRLLARPHVEAVTESSGFSKFRRRTLFAREGFRSYCAAPLVARSRAMGVLEVFHRSSLRPDGEWLGFLDALASYAAIAIDGATMFDRLQKGTPHGARKGKAAPRFTPLERQILGQVVEGTTNAAIGESVHLSQSTVKFHVRQILQKVGAGNRTELARMATREGWL